MPAEPDSPRSRRRSGGWAVLLLLASLGLLATCSPPKDQAVGVHLLAPARIEQPRARLEVRFDAPVASVAEVGLPATESPLLLNPPAAGEFLWTSRRSGVFTPSAAWRLGTQYTVTLRPGLVDADGKPCRARLRRHFRTPPLEARASVVQLDRRFWPSGTANPGQAHLWFNAPMDLAAMTAHCAYVADDGRRITAVVERVVEAAGTMPTTQAMSAVEAPSGIDSFADWLPDEAKPNTPSQNAFIVSPAKRLEGTNAWSLVLERGLPARNPALRLPEAVVFEVGREPTLELLRVDARNSLRHGLELFLRFNHPLPPTLSSTDVLSQLEILPKVANLRVEVAHRQLILRASATNGSPGFVVGQSYSIALPAGFPGPEWSGFTPSLRREFVFKPLAPRVYFPAYSAEQMATDHQQFRLLSLNLNDLWVRSKRLDRSQLIHALRGYAGYDKSHRLGPDQWSPHTEVDYNVVPGVTVLDVHPKLTAPQDTTQMHKFAWKTLLGGRRYGAIFLDARDLDSGWGQETRTGSQAVLQLTDLGLQWKCWDSNVLVQVFSHATGEAVSGARVEIVSEEDEPHAQATTDAEGLAWLHSVPETDWLIVSKDEDMHAVSLDRGKTTLYRTGVKTDFWSSGEESKRFLLFSDRGVYRPGDTLHLKAIVRDASKDELRTPAPFHRTLVLLNPEWDEVLRTNLVFNERGSAALDLALPTEPRGRYQIILKTDSWQDPQHAVLVADYQPNPFELSLAVPEEIGPDQPLRATVQARYLFGAPVARGHVRWSAEVSDTTFEPPGFDDWLFAPHDWEMRAFGLDDISYSLEGNGRHTAATNCVIAPEIHFNPTAPGPLEVLLRAELTDLGQQTVSTTARVTVHSSECYLGVRQPEEVFVAGEEAGFDLVVVGRDGKPWPEPLNVTARLQRVEWRSIRYLGAGNRPAYRSEPCLTNRVERPVVIQPLKANGPFHQGTTRLAFTLPDPGQYFLELEGRDPAGHRLLTALTFYVAGQARLAWDYRHAPRLELVPDRALYQPGETATVLIKAPFTGRALVSVERGAVRRAFVIRVTGNAPVVQVPLVADDAPNVFVSVTLLRGASESPHQVKMPDFRFGVCRLDVDPGSHRLKVGITSDSDHYRPAAPVRLTVRVTDAEGRPVPDAELTVFAADEGVLTLDGYTIPDPMATFYQTWPLRVRTRLSLFRLLTEDPDHWTYPNKGYVIGGGGRSNLRLRHNWEPCPLWIASELTDASGRAEASFTAPDSLTRYRLIAVAHTAGQQFGLGVGNFEVRKPIMLQPALPLFARVGDLLQARAVLRNQTEQARDLTVRLTLDGTAKPAQAPTGGALTWKGRLAAGAERAVEFPLRMAEVGDARWIWEAVAEGSADQTVGDRVESRLKVAHPTPPLREVLWTHLAAGATNLLAAADPILREGRGTATVRISDSASLGLAEAFRDLLHYPYGCVEQTSSSLLPWLLVQRDPVLRAVLEVDPEKARAAIAAGVKRLFTMQTAGGGLAYWPGGSDAQLWGSAYAGMVLVMLKKTGVPLPGERFEKLLDYLGEQANQVLGHRNPSAGESDHCLVALALALAGRCPPPLTAALYGQRGKLSAEGQAWLAAAIALSTGVDERTGALLQAKDDGQSGDPYGGLLRQQAVQSLARTLCEPEANATAIAAHRLQTALRKTKWRTTQANAWAVFALTEYANRWKADPGVAAGELRWGAAQTPFALSPTVPLHEQQFNFTDAQAALPLRLANTGERPLFIETELRGRASRPLTRPLDQGFRLTRSYRRTNADGKVVDLSGLRVGDPVLVRLELRTDRAAQYVAIEDLLPAVLEPVNLPSQRPAQAPSSTPADTDTVETLWLSFREMRADRVRFFVDHLRPGTFSITYLARARCAGETIAPSAKVEAMYDPARRGLSGAEKITCQPAP